MTRFFNDESGAVTVDWVVLTAGLVGLGLATMSVVNTGVEDLSGDIDGTLNGADGRPLIWTSFAMPVPFVIDNETLAGVVAYGEAGRTLAANDTLGSVSGDNAYVITSSLVDENGLMGGGFRIDTPAGEGFIEGESYKVSYWARSETGNVNLRTFPYGANEDGAHVPDYAGMNDATVGTEWTKVEYEYTATKADERLFLATNDLGVTYAVDDVSIELLR